MTPWKKRQSISQFLEVGFEKFFDGHMKIYISRLKMIKQNRFDTDCKNELAILTCWISFTGPFERKLFQNNRMYTLVTWENEPPIFSEVLYMYLVYN